VSRTATSLAAHVDACVGLTCTCMCLDMWA